MTQEKTVVETLTDISLDIIKDKDFIIKAQDDRIKELKEQVKGLSGVIDSQTQTEQALIKRLQEAEDVIMFYKDECFRDTDDDNERIKTLDTGDVGYYVPTNRLAKEYLNKYKEQSK